MSLFAGPRPGRRAALFLPPLLALAACGGVPRPTEGRPGRLGARLAVPLAIRVAVAPPAEALLADASARLYAERLAEALQELEVPAVATDAPLPLDWRLVVRASAQGSDVRPAFELLNADGSAQGATTGSPVPARAWAEGAPEALAASAREGAPRVASLLGTIQAARAGAADAAQIAGTAPQRVRVVPGRGAPGDGNTALSGRLREFLAARGYVAQDAADGAAFAVGPEVRVAAAGPGVQRVEIQWVVSRRDGERRGRVVQLNEVPAGRLDRFWGDIAYAAAEQAAGGVQQVLRNATPAPPPP